MKATSLLAGAAAFALPSFAAPLAASLMENVVISNGALVGNPRDANGIVNYKGIRYVQPPIGNLRWHSPQPPADFNGTFNATAYGPSCYANTPPVTTYATPPSEDCLCLNVWTGARAATEKRPVMMFVHGGGFAYGSGSLSTYEGTHLAEDGVVVVTINYRLGVFGFLALAELDTEGSNSGNFGLQDALAALQWIKKNIAAFGGDPENVTIFGESAGAHAVGLLMSSPLSKGLFHKAILESGAFFDSAAGPLKDFTQSRSRGAAFQKQLAAPNVASLRALSADVINAAAPFHATINPNQSTFAPALDNYVLPSNPGTIFTLGQQIKVPLLAGWNFDEGQTFAANAIPATTQQQFETGATKYFGSTVPSPFRDLYPDSAATDRNRSSIDLVGDMMIREQPYTALNLHRTTSGLPPCSIYAYQFNFTSAFTPDPQHTTELPYVFGNFVPNPAVAPIQGNATAADQALSLTLRKYWTNFAKTSNPNTPQVVPAWPPYSGAGVNVQSLASTVQPFDYDAARLAYIAGFRTNGALPQSWQTVNVSAS